MSSKINWDARDEVDKTIQVEFSMVEPSVDVVDARPIRDFPGRASVNLAGSRIQVTVRGDIARLRAWAVEIDRQLALLEIEHRVDEAVVDDADARGGLVDPSTWPPCPDCGRGQPVHQADCPKVIRQGGHQDEAEG